MLPCVLVVHHAIGVLLGTVRVHKRLCKLHASTRAQRSGSVFRVAFKVENTNAFEAR
jgi:hypothetical protein